MIGKHHTNDRYDCSGPLPCTLCDDCNQGLEFNDWSHVDFYHDGEEAEKEHARLSARVLELGPMQPVGHDDEVHFPFTCDVCGRTVDGTLIHDTCTYWQQTTARET